VPGRARWVLTGITSPAGLWRAETALMAKDRAGRPAAGLRRTSAR